MARCQPQEDEPLNLLATKRAKECGGAGSVLWDKSQRSQVVLKYSTVQASLSLPPVLPRGTEPQGNPQRGPRSQSIPSLLRAASPPWCPGEGWTPRWVWPEVFPPHIPLSWLSEHMSSEFHVSGRLLRIELVWWNKNYNKAVLDP